MNVLMEIACTYLWFCAGTYYSDALFYLSLGLHKIAGKDQLRAVMLDCDVQFAKDILLLYKEFDR